MRADSFTSRVVAAAARPTRPWLHITVSPRVARFLVAAGARSAPTQRDENLRNVVLSGADQGGAGQGREDLTGANLYGAILTRAQLGHAMLDNARLISANLHDANLHFARLVGAILTGARL